MGGRANNGTDYLIHDHFGSAANQPVTIVEQFGMSFSLLSLDTSEWEQSLGLGHTLTVTGHFQGGGQIVANILTDNVFGFQTINFGNAWQNLTQVDLIGSSSNQGNCAGFNVCGALAYDNIHVVTANIPEPSTLAIFALGVLALASRRSLLIKKKQ